MVQGANSHPGTLPTQPLFPYWFRLDGDLGELVIVALKNIPDLHSSEAPPPSPPLSSDSLHDLLPLHAPLHVEPLRQYPGEV